MKKQSTIKWKQRGAHSSSNANIHPYLMEGNSAAETFAKIAENRKAIKANGGKTTGIELKDFQDD